MKADELIQSRRVLLVDDEPYILEGLSRQVGDQFDVTTAGSGSEALALLRSGLRFAVIVADMRMPGMDGVEFLVHARAIDPTAIRMMLTGNNDRQTAIDALDKGQVFHFLNKPCSRERLLNSLEAGTKLYNLQSRIEDIKTFLHQAS